MLRSFHGCLDDVVSFPLMKHNSGDDVIHMSLDIFRTSSSCVLSSIHHHWITCMVSSSWRHRLWLTA